MDSSRIVLGRPGMYEVLGLYMVSVRAIMPGYSMPGAVVAVVTISNSVYGYGVWKRVLKMFMLAAAVDRAAFAPAASSGGA